MSFKDEVIALLKDTAVKLFGISADGLSGATRFKEDLNCKSVDVVRFTAALEDEYDVEVPFMAFNRCASFEEAAQYMSRLLGIE